MKVRKRVRTLPSGTVKVRWECDLGFVNGKRVAKWFTTEEAAEEHLAAEKARLKRFGEAAYDWNEADRHAYTRAVQRLATVGADLDAAVEYYMARHQPLVKDITLADLLAEFVLAMELKRKRPRYVGQLGVSGRAFVRGREERSVRSVTRAEVVEWLAGSGWAAKTQKGYLGDLRTLYSYAMERHYVGENPFAGTFAFPEEEPEEIVALSVEQCKALLGEAVKCTPASQVKRKETHERPPLLWYTVLGLFAGVRPMELARMDRAQVDLVERHVLVKGKSAKTRQRRVVDLTEEAVAWLALDPVREGPVRPKNFTRLWGTLRYDAGFLNSDFNQSKLRPPDPRGKVWWPHDAMRHTFASMHYAHHQDEALLKAQMGHSKDEDTLMQHYRALKTRKEAEAFWALAP